jgi:hypothetical protein
MKWLHSNSQYTSFVLFTSFILWSAACAIWCDIMNIWIPHIQCVCSACFPIQH